MLALERRNLILEKLQEEKKVVVSELSQFYNVSEETIRRDLEKLEQDGYATKSYGGAVLNENVGFDMPLTIRSKHHVAEKQVIAEIAASLVKEGDHIMLDASSTDLFIAKAIKNIQRLTVVTNSIEIILELSECSNITVICTGGVFVDKAFVSCKALNREHGIMESLQAFSSLKKAILTSAAQSYLVLDNGKFDQTAFTKMVGIEEIDGVITDTRPSDDWLQIFERYGVECMYPPEKRK